MLPSPWVNVEIIPLTILFLFLIFFLSFPVSTTPETTPHVKAGKMIFLNSCSGKYLIHASHYLDWYNELAKVLCNQSSLGIREGLEGRAVSGRENPTWAAV